MSLLCSETGKDIKFGKTLMAGTRSDVKFYSALSQDVLKQIPESKKRLTPCEPGVGGVNIHNATSSRNFNGSYTLCDFRLENFSFSISEETAREYLPTHYRLYSALKSA